MHGLIVENLRRVRVITELNRACDHANGSSFAQLDLEFWLA